MQKEATEGLLRLASEREGEGKMETDEAEEKGGRAEIPLKAKSYNLCQ